MSVKLRLRRMGKKRQPVYKLVAADSRSPRDGRFIEALGKYIPQKSDKLVEYNEERAMYWLKTGAEPTDTVQNLLSKQGTLLKFDMEKKKLPEEKVQEELAKFFALQAERESKNAQKKAKKSKKAKKENSAK